MPYYHEKKLGKRSFTRAVDADKKNVDTAKQYISLLIQYQDDDFAQKLLSELTKQQRQTLRMIYKKSDEEQKRRRNSPEAGLMEHPIPVRYTVKVLSEYIRKRDKSNACAYIDFIHECVPQIFLTRKQDDSIDYTSRMPDVTDGNGEKENGIGKKTMSLSDTNKRIVPRKSQQKYMKNTNKKFVIIGEKSRCFESADRF